MSKQVVAAVITDLDNTLYDWVRVWYHPFKVMLDKVVNISGIPADKLLPEIKRVFETRGTSEYSRLLEELPSLQAKYPDEDLADVLADAIDAYREQRREHLCLYPGVMETLKALKEYGCTLVGYTESMEFYSNYRIKKLGLDGILDVVYYPREEGLPDDFDLQSTRFYDHSHYKLQQTESRYTPDGELKPNPHVLASIVEEIGVAPAAVLYVGDSLMKDIAMAQHAGITDVYAKYGVANDRPEYELLRQVTHWKEKHVQAEKTLNEDEIKPTYVLRRSFTELLAKFSFCARSG